MTKDEVLSRINPGIRNLVAWLWDLGFETCDSGDGETHEFECDRPYPYVSIRTEPSNLVSEAKRLAALLQGQGIELRMMGPEDPLGYAVIEANYNPVRERLSAVIDLMGIADSHCPWL